MRKWESKYAQAEFNGERVQLAVFLRGADFDIKATKLAMLLCETDGLGGLHNIPTPGKFLDTLLNHDAWNKLFKHYESQLLTLREARAKAKLDLSRGNSLSRATFNQIVPESQTPSLRQKRLKKQVETDKDFNDAWNSLMGIDSLDKAKELRDKDALIATESTQPVIKRTLKIKPSLKGKIVMKRG